ncbi:hypothetical protein VTO73DRAFT_15589 [Trametes versicolor]
MLRDARALNMMHPTGFNAPAVILAPPASPGRRAHVGSTCGGPTRPSRRTCWTSASSGSSPAAARAACVQQGSKCSTTPSYL